MDAFYDEYISPRLPDKILDFHTHVWMPDQWIKKPETSWYVATDTEYPLAALMEDGRLSFPDKEFYAVCFGHPTPVVNTALTNAYVAKSTKKELRLYPLLVAGSGKVAPDVIERELNNNGFLGYKVFLDWHGNEYGSIRVEDMLNEAEIEIADRRRLVVLLHVPRSGRLADPVIQAGVRKLSKACPNASIVLAHCGRCYHPLEMNMAVASIANLENVYMDTSMVMEPIVVMKAIKAMGAGRVLFGSDFPVANMRGKRVNIRDHWVDIVAQGYPQCQYRVGSDAFNTMYMAQEIALSVVIAADAAGIDQEALNGIFYNNGIKILERAASI